MTPILLFEQAATPIPAALGNWVLILVVFVALGIFYLTGWRNKMPRHPHDDGLP